MKSIYLIGFRGTGFQDLAYVNELPLIRAGHVGFAFEDDLTFILGFHPTPYAIQKMGGEDAALEWLKENEPLEGSLQFDTQIFLAAFNLYLLGARTQVWKWMINVSERDYNRIKTQAFRWYNENTIFTYAFPPRGQRPHADRDNCATFPRRLGLPLPESSGQLAKYNVCSRSYW